MYWRNQNFIILLWPDETSSFSFVLQQTEASANLYVFWVGSKTKDVRTWRKKQWSLYFLLSHYIFRAVNSWQLDLSWWCKCIVIWIQQRLVKAEGGNLIQESSSEDFDSSKWLKNLFKKNKKQKKTLKLLINFNFKKWIIVPCESFRYY